MWVYGDRTRRLCPAELLAEVEADWAAGESVSALIGLGQLLQGVADAEFTERGFDARSPACDALMALLVDVACLTLPSAHPPESGDPGVFTGAEAPAAQKRKAWAPAFAGGSGALGALHPEKFEVRVPEGYAFYALHPGLYAAAARRLPPGDWRVIGVRSIGTSLAAVVAAVLGASPPVTVRPTGDPFDRRLALAPELEAEWAAHTGPFVIVDEGPGLSGSSFGAVADALERLGVARERIAFLPGHGGDLGLQASPEHRARWAGALRPVAEFDGVILPELAAGVEALVGPATTPMQDISGGGWRALRNWPERPPVNAGQERRKFLHRTAQGAWLVKFTGLGRIGRDKLTRARALHAAGFGPEPAGVVAGFHVEHWGNSTCMPDVDPRFLGRLGDYLAFRATAFPADEAGGASVTDLLKMARANAAEALGAAAGEAVVSQAAASVALEPRMRRVHVDGRLHAWEWLQQPDGRVLKADALDHSEGHDLIGAQDIAWDVAGAEAEFDLTAEQLKRLRARVDVDPELLAFLRLAYPAFQLGLWTLAAQGQTGWADEGARAQAQADRYARRLAALLGVDPPPRQG